MANAKGKTKKLTVQESDSSYVLKLVLYLIIGSQWLWITTGNQAFQIPLPLGFVIGLVFARHEHFQIDRKIEYAILLIAAIISFWFQIGVFVTV